MLLYLLIIPRSIYFLFKTTEANWKTDKPTIVPASDKEKNNFEGQQVQLGVALKSGFGVSVYTFSCFISCREKKHKQQQKETHSLLFQKRNLYCSLYQRKRAKIHTNSVLEIENTCSVASETKSKI